MSFSIVDSKIKNYTRPIQDLIISREQKEPIAVQSQPQVVQEQKVQTETVNQYQNMQSQNVIQNQAFLLEKRKPFQLKSRDRFQARRTMSQTHVSQTESQVVVQPLPPVIVQPLPPVVIQPPLPLVQLPSTQSSPSSTVENKDHFDEFGYSIDEI